MGHREVRRVPLNFDAPLNEVWRGYINPNLPPITCSSCGGSGLNPATRQIEQEWYDHDGFGTRWTYQYNVAPDGSPATRPPWRVIGENRSWMHSLTQDEVDALIEHDRLYMLTKDGHHPTADEVNQWALHDLMGHDAINRWICVETRAKRLGVWGECVDCAGSGSIWQSEDHKRVYEGWQEFEPPTGEGWQLWETTTEGSPQSPVFSTPEALADWCESNATIFADERMTRDEWLDLILRDQVDIGSMLVGTCDYLGSEAHMPKELAG